MVDFDIAVSSLQIEEAVGQNQFAELRVSLCITT